MKKYSVDIICPLYNAEKYIENLHNSIIMQKDIEIKNIFYMLTECDDNTENYLKLNDIQYELVKRKDFSHSLTREKAALKSKADVLVFITQDVIIKDNQFIYKLIKPIIEKESAASFARQLCDNNSIEKYTREMNYPNESYINTKNDIKEKGLKTFFFSDAASAVDRKIYQDLKGYDKKDLPTNEDMYLAYKLIMNDYKIKYCSDAIVIHSHDFSLKEQYDRYRLTGIFMKQNNYLDKFGTTKSGGGLAKYVLKRALQEKNIKVLVKFIPNMAARYIGMKVGKKNG